MSKILILLSFLLSFSSFAKNTKLVYNFSYTINYDGNFKYNIDVYENTYDDGKKEYVATTKINNTFHKRTVLKPGVQVTVAKTPKSMDSKPIVYMRRHSNKNWKNHFRISYPTNMMKEKWEAFIYKIEDTQAFKYHANDGNSYYSDFSKVRIKGVKKVSYIGYGKVPVGFYKGLNSW
jgi:hypothetical protein